MSKKYFFIVSMLMAICSTAASYSYEPTCCQIANRCLSVEPRDGSIRSLTRVRGREVYCQTPVTTFDGRTIPGSRNVEMPLASRPRGQIVAVPVAEPCPYFFGRPYYQSFNRAPCQVNEYEMGLSFHMSRVR